MLFTNSGRIKVTPNYVLEYNLRENCNGGSIPPKLNFSYGYLSEDSIRSIKQKVNLMCYIASDKQLRKSIKFPVAQYKLVFITLTLSSAQIHPDKLIKERLLQPILRQLRNKWKVNNYLWKAEAQDNGNIHFHITTDKYIHWEELRISWNAIQETLGYITRSGISNPNSTDVTAVYKAKNVAAYLAGYIGKKDQYKKSDSYELWQEHYYKDLLSITACDLKTREVVEVKRPLEGKLYDCNQELKKVRAVWESNYAMSHEMEEIEISGGKRITEPFITIQFTGKSGLKGSPVLKQLLDNSIEKVYSDDVKAEDIVFGRWVNLVSKQLRDYDGVIV